MRYSVVEDKVREVIFDYPDKRFHVRGIARLTGFSAPAVSNALDKLEKRGLIEIKKGFLHEITATKSEKFAAEKKISNLKKIYDSGLVDYLKEEMPLTTMILFGSYSRGQDSEKSDIDIAILEKEQKLNTKRYSEKLKREIHLEFVNMRKISKELKNNILNGIVLSGGLRDELWRFY